MVVDTLAGRTEGTLRMLDPAGARKLCAGLDLLVECMQGPCEPNEEAVAGLHSDRSAVDGCKLVLSTPSLPLLSERQAQKLRGLATKCLVSMLEGRQVSAAPCRVLAPPLPEARRTYCRTAIDVMLARSKTGRASPQGSRGQAGCQLVARAPGDRVRQLQRGEHAREEQCCGAAAP